jgi:hypothetical protein
MTGEDRASPRLFVAALAMLLLMMGACTSEQQRQSAMASPWPEDGAPDVLHVLADDLLAFQAVIKRLPDDLARLDHSGLATNGPYAGTGYAYHPAGIGILREGWRIIVADDRMREAGKVWCIVRAPARLTGTPALRVVLVPMAELNEAAMVAGAGRGPVLTPGK